MASETEPRYLDVISSAQQIHDFPVNDSTAKQLYSFAKAERFPDSYYRPHCSEAFYDIHPSVFRSKRSCSLGKGNKMDFTRNVVANPAPNTYNPLNNTVAHNKAPKSSFGISRELSPHMGIFRKPGETPGPGAYDPKEIKTQKTCEFRVKTRSKNFFENPNGPGTYDILRSFQPAGDIVLSQFRSTSTVKFAPVSSAVPRESPQPELFYDTKFQMNKTGVFFNSKYKNSLCRSFGKGYRSSTTAADDGPGPGDYRLPSDFGFYESSVYSQKGKSKFR